MKDQWVGNNVDLTILSNNVEKFLANSQFETKLEHARDKFRITASNFAFKITVRIYGRPNDFMVEFDPNKRSQGFSWSMIFGSLATLFGGGGVLLRDVKLQESVSTFEKLFWDFMDRQVAELKDSAK